MNTRTIYSMFRPHHVATLEGIRRKLAKAEGTERVVWRRRLKVAQRNAKRFRDECLR